MDYNLALRRMAELKAAKDKFVTEQIEPIAKRAEGAGATRADIPDELAAQLDSLQAQIVTFGAQLNATPEFQDVLPYWNVTISGMQSIEPDFIDSIARQPDRGRAMTEAFQRLGGMPNSISRALSQIGYQQHSREVMRGGWRIGMRCTEGASRRLCALLHRRFRAAIEGGSISVERRFADFAMHRNPMAGPS